jgi:prevent-host-death family protein
MNMTAAALPEHVGVRDLKARLSAHLQRVRGGARLTVTDRGRAIATIVPVDASASLEWVHTLVATGRARWQGGKPAGLTRRIPARGKAASAMVIEDRR